MADDIKNNDTYDVYTLDGKFITTDTNRLYIGNGSDKPKLLNQTV